MKRVLSILFCVMIVASMFALTVSANAEEADNAYVAAQADETGDAAEYTESAEETRADAEDPTEEETVEETVGETEAETTEETTAETVAETEAATEAATQAATTPAKTANTPKTSDNFMIFVWIGIAAVAVIGIIITFVVSSKKKKAQK